MKIAILDTIGLRYHGDSLKTRGLGGSESALIYISRELVALGNAVTVFIRLEGPEMDYDGVHYVDNSKARNNTKKFDVLISSRNCVPFAPITLRNQLLKETGCDISAYTGLVYNSEYKVVWLHDCFMTGDPWFEGLMVDGFIDEVFTISDWQTSYVTNGHTWRGRIYEVLKQHVFQTRNGVKRHLVNVDISKKDRNQFFYNSSISKGMTPLIEECWPLIRRRIPEAKLVVIGGYYRGAGANEGADEQELNYFKLVEKYDQKDGITFTGIIKQDEIARILAESYLMVYPASGHPETFSISVLESLMYNTPVVSFKFGAIEETAVAQCSYLVDYSLDYGANHLDGGKTVYNPSQVNRFVDEVYRAYSDTHLWNQKANACNELKPWIGWDTVARQWEQHLSRVPNVDAYLPINKQTKVRRVNDEVHRLFSRRFVNQEDVVYSNPSPSGRQKRIVIITPMYNASSYIEKCIRSVANQYYGNYHMYIVDDMSTDNSVLKAKLAISTLDTGLVGKFKVIENVEKKCAVENQVLAIDDWAHNDDDIIVLLDGDDWLVNDSNIFSYLNTLYTENSELEMTYGSFRSVADNIDMIAQPYPPEVHQHRTYRQHHFPWGMPYTHLRTFSDRLFEKIDRKMLLDDQGRYYKAGGDNALFYQLLEHVDNGEHGIHCVQRPLMVYNDINPIADRFVNAEEQNRNASIIQGTKGHVNEVNNHAPILVEKPKEKFNMVVDNRYHDLGQSLYDVHTGVAHRDPIAIAAHKDILQHRDQVWIDNTDSGNIAPRRNWLINKIKSLGFDANARILDIGAWTGALANDIRNAGFPNITCMDISDKVVHDGQLEFPYFHWIRADIEDFFLAIKFDIIIMGEIIEHLFDPYGVINRLRTNLTPNGVILYTIPTEETVLGETPNSALEHVSVIKLDDIQKYSEDLEILIPGGFFHWYAGSIKSIASAYENLITAKILNDDAGVGVDDEGLHTQVVDSKKINVLIALPTAKNIETDTFLSIYRQKVADNVDTYMECFYGYNIDQVRNLICHFGIINKFDYVFFVDSDIVLPLDALSRLLAANVDIVSGVYIQRKEEKKIPEIYRKNSSGGLSNIDVGSISGGLTVVDGCGFGCVLVKTSLLVDVGYPQFVYHDTLDFSGTVSEDVDFCIKVTNLNVPIYVDMSLRCEHIGATRFRM